jgi:type I restriction enzyme S subunit
MSEALAKATNWRSVTLGEVLNLKRGYDLPRQARCPGPYPVVSSSGITDHHAQFKVRGPGVVTGRYGTLGDVFYIPGDYWPLNTSLYVEDFKGNDPRFIVSLLSQLDFASRNAAGAVPGINRNHLHGLPVRLPPIATQRRIASILSAYDDLIENCQRRIAILEEMARALYREWFVEFRYPGYEAYEDISAGAGSSRSGWRQCPLQDAAALIARGIAPHYDEAGKSVVINQKCIRDQRLSLEPARRQSREVPREKKLLKGDVLINSTGVGTLGRVTQVLDDLGNCTVDTHVTIVRPTKGVDHDYFGCLLLNAQPVFERMGVGATGQTELGRRDIGAVEIHLPPDRLQREFGTLVRPIRDAAVIYAKQVQNLRLTRDLLLPRLLSGELAVA